MRLIAALFLLFTTTFNLAQQGRNAIWVNGAPIGAIGPLNIMQPTGLPAGCSINWTVTANAALHTTDLAGTVNTACALSISTAQSGAPTFCNSSNGTPAYTCSLSATHVLLGYTPGMTILLMADGSNSGPASLNIDNLGVRSIKQTDGTTDPTPGTFLPGHFHLLVFDGTVWRILA